MLEICLATIGVCVFRALTAVGALFVLGEGMNMKEILLEKKFNRQTESNDDISALFELIAAHPSMAGRSKNELVAVNRGALKALFLAEALGGTFELASEDGKISVCVAKIF